MTTFVPLALQDHCARWLFFSWSLLEQMRRIWDSASVSLCKVTGLRSRKARMWTQASASKFYNCWEAGCTVALNEGFSKNHLGAPWRTTICIPSTEVLLALYGYDLSLGESSPDNSAVQSWEPLWRDGEKKQTQVLLSSHSTINKTSVWDLCVCVCVCVCVLPTHKASNPIHTGHHLGVLWLNSVLRPSSRGRVTSTGWWPSPQDLE
jgi:hypothetical protein